LVDAAIILLSIRAAVFAQARKQDTNKADTLYNPKRFGQRV